MSFFHACNESGLFSEAALDTIEKFPMVTIEKGQGFNDGSPVCTATAGLCAEDKILNQIRAVKKRDPSISVRHDHPLHLPTFTPPIYHAAGSAGSQREPQCGLGDRLWGGFFFPGARPARGRNREKLCLPSCAQTVFYMNSVLDWYFYRMHYEFLLHPEWCAQVLGSWGNTTRDAVRDKERRKGRRTPTQDPSTHTQPKPASCSV